MIYLSQAPYLPSKDLSEIFIQIFKQQVEASDVSFERSLQFLNKNVIVLKLISKINSKNLYHLSVKFTLFFMLIFAHYMLEK